MQGARAFFDWVRSTSMENVHLRIRVAQSTVKLVYKQIVEEVFCMNFKVPRGTQDILPGQSEKWQKVEAIIRDLCRVYLHAALEKQRTSFKKKCTHSKIVVVVH